MNKLLESKITHFKMLYKEWDKLEKKIISTKNILVHKSCPVCKKKQYKILFKKKGLYFVKCNCKAEHVFINPSINNNYLTNHFMNSSSWKIWSKKVLKSKKNYSIDKKKYSIATRIIKKNLNRKSRILDVGCANGNFINYCKRYFHCDCYGIEPSKEAFKLAKINSKNKVFNTNFENFKSQEKFDLICFWASFEYCTDIDLVMKKIKTLLKKNGILLIYISGNSSSLIMKTLREKCVGFIFNRTHYFSPKSLNELLKKNKFKIIYEKSFISEIKEILNYLNYNKPYEKHKSNRNNNFDKEFIKKLENLILSKMMGYKFLSIHKK